MSQLFKSFDLNMRRAVAAAQQQSNPSLSKNSRSHRQSTSCASRCCIFMIMMTPLALVLMIMYVLSLYNDMIHYEQQQQQQQLAQHQQQHEVPQAAVSEGNKINDNFMMLRKNQQQNLKQQRPRRQTLVLGTKLGDIRIFLRPDLSQGSVDYIHQLVDRKDCHRCNLYRAEKPGILQGVMENKDVPINTVRGDCPPDSVDVPVGDCPEWDKDCGCHGPLMTRGSVAWAAGLPGGPDFFIDNYPTPANFWGTQHTNFGFIQDKSSLNIVDIILDLPKTNRDGLNFLNDVISFDMRLEEEGEAKIEEQ